jgi:ABC-type polar amino acid transport system ATPase subunit
LRKSFGARAVLGGVDANIEAGRIVALVGPSGCGKTTLLRCLNGLETFDDGRIEIDGQTLAPGRADAAFLQRLRTRVGMVFQEFHLFPHMTALENVTLALEVVLKRPRDRADARAMELLGEVGLADRAESFPHELSGGQKQRVAIARALAPPIEVLLLDEPTSALDPEMREEVRAALHRIAEHTKLTMIMATHDMRLARDLADEIWVMKSGEIVERGPTDRVLASPQSDVAKDFFARVRD